MARRTKKPEAQRSIILTPLRTVAILTEEVCSQELQDTRLDYGESETGHAVIVAACPVRLAGRIYARLSHISTDSPKSRIFL